MTAIEAQVDEAADGVWGGSLGHSGNVSRLLHCESNVVLRRARSEHSQETQGATLHTRNPPIEQRWRRDDVELRFALPARVIGLRSMLCVG